VGGRRIARSLALFSAALVLAACGLLPKAADQLGGHPPRGRASSPGSATSPQPGASAASPTLPNQVGLAKYYHQHVDWQPCNSGFQCARIAVPLDYAKPNGAAISLAIVKRPAGDPSQRIGSLLVNPGGPGASGIQYAEAATSIFSQGLLDHFDIVGFDPRGVGQSSPIHCISNARLDQLIAYDPDPQTPAEVQRSIALLRQFAAGCQRRSGALLAHVSTPEAARDMDILRALVGDPKLDYFGASYGTYLGATYAQLFPKRVGRMVLDGAVDPALSPEQMSLVQAKGFQTALRSYVSYCVRQPDCPVGTSVTGALNRIAAFLDQVDRHPLPGDGQRQLTEGYAVLGIALPLYVRSYWPLLTSALRAGLAGDGSALLRLADAYTSRGPNGFTDNSNEVIYAVNCLDHPDRMSVAAIERSIPRFDRASSVFGSIFAWGALACAHWPVHAEQPVPKISAPGAPPILVIGTTRDPATPYQEAVALARELKSGVLLTRNGDGHTAYMSGNTCIDSTVDAYLISGTVPPNGKRC
jgi:pimeloyl-ACP methyl ester carboxylesterase